MVNGIEAKRPQEALTAYQEAFEDFLKSRGLQSYLVGTGTIANHLKRAGQSAHIEWTGDEEYGSPKLPPSLQAIVDQVYGKTGAYVVERVGLFDKAAAITIAPTETNRLLSGGFVKHPNGLLVSTELLFDLAQRGVWIGTLDPKKPRYQTAPQGLEDSLQQNIVPFNGTAVGDLTKMVQGLQTKPTGTRIIIEPFS